MTDHIERAFDIIYGRTEIDKQKLQEWRETNTKIRDQLMNGYFTPNRDDRDKLQSEYKLRREIESILFPIDTEKDNVIDIYRHGC